MTIDILLSICVLGIISLVSFSLGMVYGAKRQNREDKKRLLEGFEI